jgi:hypothetical protein
MKPPASTTSQLIGGAASQPAHPGWVRSEVDDVLARHGGAATRSALVARVGRAVFDHEVRRGELTAIFPRVYCRSWLADDCAVQQIAAVRSCGVISLLSHTTALARFGVAEAGPGQPIHVTSNAPRHPRGVPDRLVVHRTRSALVRSLATGLPTTGLAEALVQSWPLLRGAEQRAPLSRASRQRMIRPAEVSAHLDLYPKLAGRSRLAELLRLLEMGCESELELWGTKQCSIVQNSGTLAGSCRSGPATAPFESTWRSKPRSWRLSWTVAPITPGGSSGNVTSAGTWRWPPSAGRPSGCPTTG